MSNKVEFITVDLLSRIYRRQFANGRLPTQRDLAIEYGVSRSTIQLVVRQLEEVGALVAVQGSGMFVRANILRSPLVFNTITRRPYASIRSETLDLVREAPTEAECRLFQISRDVEVWRFTRLRLVEGVREQIERSVLLTTIVPALDEATLARSVQGHVEELGHRISHFFTTYRAVTLSAQDARLLLRHRGTPAMNLENRGVLRDGRVFIHSDVTCLDYDVSYIQPFNREAHAARLRSARAL